MEAERRSTMSSLKGQLSNVEGSVKSMKAAVVVGSVLTVACLAAVFGVTILANEVSKEVKVSNNTLTTKSGANVMTQNVFVTEKAVASTSQVFATLNGNDVIMAINSRVFDNNVDMMISDGAFVRRENGNTHLYVQPDSLLAQLITAPSDEVEKRNLNCPPCIAALVWAAKGAVWCAMRRVCRKTVKAAVSYGAMAIAGELIPDPPQN